MATGICQEDVWAAADALLLERARPTIEKVRQKIGRGSPNTVSPHLDSWFGALGGRIAGSQPLTARVSVPDPVIDAAKALWKTASDTARAEQSFLNIENEKALEQKVSEIDAERDRVVEQQNRLAARERDLVEAARAAREQGMLTETRLAKAEAALHDKETELSQLRDAARTHHDELRSAASKVEQLRAEFSQTLSGVETRHLAHERKWMTELDEERSKRKKLDVDLAKRQRELEEATHTLKTAHDELKLRTRRVEQLEEQFVFAAKRQESELGHLRQSQEREKVLLDRRVAIAESLADRLNRTFQERENNLQRLLEVAQAHSTALLSQLQTAEARAKAPVGSPLK